MNCELCFICVPASEGQVSHNTYSRVREMGTLVRKAFKAVCATNEMAGREESSLSSRFGG